MELSTSLLISFTVTMAVCSELSFAISFLKPEEFAKAMDFCGSLILDVTDTVMGENGTIVCFKVTAFLNVVNLCFTEHWDVRVHVLNNTCV